MNYKAGLDNLKPEVREAAKYCDEIFDGSDNGEWATIRAELLRLAKCESELAALKARIAESVIWHSGDFVQTGSGATELVGGKRYRLLLDE